MGYAFYSIDRHWGDSVGLQDWCVTVGIGGSAEAENYIDLEYCCTVPAVSDSYHDTME